MRRALWLALGLALGLTPSLRADARADFVEAAEHQKAQRWGEAAQAYAKVTAQLPTYAPAWKQLATCRFYLGDLDGAEASAQRYLKLEPTDTAFSAWDAQLRQKLKLPPLDLSTPVPTAAPTPIPVDGAVTLAPPPGADAEVIGGAAASVATPPETAATSAAVEAAPAAEATAAASTPGLQAQLVEEPAPSEARNVGQRLGLRLAGSFSLGLGHFEHGEQVNSSTLPSDKPYPGQAGVGLGGLAEVLYDFGPLWELSLGVYPIQWQETQDSSQTDAVTRSNESTAKGLILPVLVGASARFPLSPLVTGILSLGLGVVPSAHVDVDSSTVQTTASSLTNTRVKGAFDYGLAPAWRLGAGMEVPMGSIVSAYVGGQVLGAQFPDASGSGSYEVIDQSGSVLASGSGGSTKAQSLSVLSASAIAGLSLRF